MKLEYKSLPYRSNVSMIAFRNTQKGKEFLIASKNNWPEDYWKFPQGGIEDGEDLLAAGKREFLEEIGTDKIKIIGISSVENRYDWDDATIEEKKRTWRGQFQRFMVLEFLGKESDVKIDVDELKAYRWVSRDEIIAYSEQKGHNLFRHYNGLMPKVFDEFGL